MINHPQCRIDRSDLKASCQSHLTAPGRSESGDVLTLKEDGTVIGLQLAVKQMKASGFPRAIGSDQAKKFALSK